MIEYELLDGHAFLEGTVTYLVPHKKQMILQVNLVEYLILAPYMQLSLDLRFDARLSATVSEYALFLFLENVEEFKARVALTVHRSEGENQKLEQ